MKKFTWILAGIFILGFGGLAALAAIPPVVPAAYWGSVFYSDQKPVTSGTVEAIINGKVCNSIDIADGGYGQGKRLVVQDSSLSGGETVQFKVKIGSTEVLAKDSISWQAGDLTEVDLHLDMVSPTTSSTQTGSGSTSSGTATSTSGGSSSSSTNTTTTSSTNSGTSSSQGSSTAGSGTQTQSSPASVSPSAGNPATVSAGADVKCYNDLNTSHWAYSDIQTMVDRGILKGTSANSFAPDASITRAQFTAILARSLKLGSPQANAAFKDVKTGDWYYTDVMAAYQAGIVNGVGTAEFAPDAKISREQMAVLLTRAMQKSGKAPAISGEDVNAQLKIWSDKEQISSWADQDLAIAIKTGFLQGYPGNRLAPTATATRAEGAAMVKRYMMKVGLW